MYCFLIIRRTPAATRPETLLPYTTLFRSLHEDDYDGWVQWLAVAGVTDLDPRRGPIVDDATVLLQTAVDGGGVALGKLSMVARELAAGTLVAPFDITVLTDLGYHLVYLPGALEREKVRIFRDFIMAEDRKSTRLNSSH